MRLSERIWTEIIERGDRSVRAGRKAAPATPVHATSPPGGPPGGGVAATRVRGDSARLGAGRVGHVLLDPPAELRLGNRADEPVDLVAALDEHEQRDPLDVV